MVFLEDEIGARPFGMGQAFTAIANDANLLQINPGGLDYIIFPEVNITYNKGLMDLYDTYFGYIQPLGNYGTIGTSLYIYDGGLIDINYPDGSQKLLKAEQDWVLTAGYGYHIGEEFCFGLNTKFISSILAEAYSAWTLAFDVGGIYRTLDDRISIALVIQNMGFPLKYKSADCFLPSSLKAGFAWKIIETERDNLLLTSDLIYSFNNIIRCNIGGEYELWKVLALRVGYKIGYNPDVICFGAGYKYPFNQGVIAVDYGLQIIGDMSINHRVSLSYQFGSNEFVEKGERYRNKAMPKRAINMFEKIKKEDVFYDIAQEKIKSIREEEQRKSENSKIQIVNYLKNGHF